MHRTTLRLLLLLVPPLACLSDVAPAAENGADTEDGSQSDGEGSSGGTADASGSSGTDDGGSDTGDGDGYPSDVSEVLDLPWPPDNYADPDLPEHFLAGPVLGFINTPPDAGSPLAAGSSSRA